MKITKLLFLSILAFAFIVQGCKKSNTPETEKTMDNMVVPDGFIFETTHDVPMTIQMPESVDFTDLRSRFDVYSDNPDNGGKLITSGSFDIDGKFSGTLRIPITLTEITVVTMAGAIIVEIPESSLKGDGIIIDFGDEYGYLPPDSIPLETKASLITNYNTINYKNTTSANLVENGDFETNDFGSIFLWSSSHPDDSRWYVSTYRGSMSQYNDGGNEVMSTPINGYNNYVGGATQTVNATAGDVLTLIADIKSIGNRDYLHSWLYLVPINASGAPIAYYNLFYTKPSDTWTTKTLVATMPTGTVEVKVLLWANDYKSNTAVFFDNVVVTGPVTDADGDGVDDDDDDYPNDGSRAFNVYYPNNIDWGTFAFEDLWPGKGDYDFNDLVVDYQFKSVLNSNNELVEFYTDYSVRAIGASLINGFAFSIPGDPSNVGSVSGTTITQSYLDINANGTEAEQENSVIFLFDNAFNMIGSSGSAFINTKPDVDYVEPTTNQLHVEFINPVSNAGGSAPYNPFIVVDETRGKEVHLAGGIPTDLADHALFGTWADDSDPANNKYYQSINNLPWALDLPTKFDYPVEQVQIIDAYNHFQEWGESGGSEFTDWDGTTSGYRNNQNIYSPPL